jgi:steroid delta-isomerase-like uncharacterized protein
MEFSHMSEANKHLIHRLITEGWNGRNFVVIDELCSANFTMNDPSAPNLANGPEAAKAYIGALVSAFPDLHMQIHDLFGEADRVSLRWSAEGTHQGDFNGIPPTNQRVCVTGQAIYRIANGKIEEDWIIVDTYGMLQQLGVIPG